ncbi:MAG: Translation elongation factor G-related protein [Candidatus Ozemobacter sibiricus]|jgi:elongation factor G|uniref:Elongation factor G n=1 Tax=Candidatus Ozemobacter sibiricus TaxID=2268124 RepID=A0A367ZRK4_9BACT|nr:MAG: Translation elongation factor G-related protein [Candidatus Ozemobacter sibiricus]
MKLYTTDKIRNIGLVSHGGAGKTTLAEAMLFHTGANTRIGKVDDGTSLMNYDPEEIKRKATIGTSLAALEWKDHKINLLDTPGFDDFLGEVYKVVLAMDTAIVVVNASAGIEVGTEKNWKILNTYNVPRLVFLSKLDKENLNVAKIVEDLTAFDKKIVPIQIPWGTAANLKGVIDLLAMKAYAYTDDTGKKVEEKEIPADLKDLAQKLHDSMVESIVECDDALMEKFFGGETISVAELKAAIRKGLAANAIKPMLCGMALKNLGTDRLLDFLLECVPSPAERAPFPAHEPGKPDAKVVLEAKVDAPACAFVFKKINEQAGDMIFLRAVSGKLTAGTELFNPIRDQSERLGNFFTLRGKTKLDLDALVAGDIGLLVKPKVTQRGDTLCDKSRPVVITLPELPAPKLTYAVNPRTKQDQEKMGSGLQMLCADDGVLRYEFDPELGQGLISGLGDTHIDVAICRLKARWNVDVDISKPKIPYRETIKGKSDVQGKHKKQSGGRGQYGDVHIRFEPLPGGDFEFVDEIVGGVVPKNFIPAVEKGLQEARKRGVIAGFPTIGFKATLHFGSYHDVDSSELAFKLAATLAFKKGIAEAKPILLEPIYEVTVMTPESFMGTVIGDLNSRRGRILGMEPAGDMQMVKAHVPLAEMYKYATDLKSMTQSRADFVMKFDHYEEVPANVTEAIVKEYGRKEAEEEE